MLNDLLNLIPGETAEQAQARRQLRRPMSLADLGKLRVQMPPAIVDAPMPTAWTDTDPTPLTGATPGLMGKARRNVSGSLGLNL